MSTFKKLGIENLQIVLFCDMFWETLTTHNVEQIIDAECDKMITKESVGCHKKYWVDRCNKFHDEKYEKEK